MATASVIIYHMLVYKFVQKLFLQLKKNDIESNVILSVT